MEELKRKMFLLHKWDILKIKVSLSRTNVFRDKSSMSNNLGSTNGENSDDSGSK